jgi:signal transduction histidine kinase
VIASHAEMAKAALEDGVDALDAAQESIARVGGGVVRMRRLIDDLLAYTTARDAPLHVQPVDLHALVSDVVGERVDHLLVRPDVYVGPLPHVDADQGMLRHVLDNLIGNALKYVPHGRVPRVDVSATPAHPGWVRVEVDDRGIGIPDPDKPRVFDTFHRAHDGSGYGGTGLGLAICRRIVDRHGGTIGVEDNPGGGSRFGFTLPLATTPEVLVSSASSSHEYV